MDVREKAFGALEFDKILNKLASYTDNPEVKERLLALRPIKELEAARRAQRDTAEAASACLKLGGPPVNLSAVNPKAAVKRTEQGGVLSARELLDISRLLYVTRRMKAYLSETAQECGTLHAYAAALETAKALEDRINLCIVSEEEIADGASSELSAIRRRKAALNAKIKDSLNSMIRSAHYKKLLQDPIVTMRGGRYVIPVRSEYRAEVPGIVHDSSSSGATLFIEPMSVVNTNNEVRDLEGREQREIERILAELSALVCDESHTLFVDYRIICELDFMFAKAKLALDTNSYEPELNDEGITELKRARHPLIDKDKVVANDIALGTSYDTLVVTGPNTGGKTVTLKTIGLFSLMAASGLHIPAEEGSRVSLFSCIYADIGDEQSIEQSLSTFSSHMVNIVNIIDGIEPGSLVLFDELGAGTDPTEGAALAISVLEYLRKRGARTVATTHYSELKLFALSTDGVENASCEFDVQSLRPTYRLLIGVPGKSNAFAISRRLGLSEAVLERANQLLSDESVRFEDVVTDLEITRNKAREDFESAERMKNELKSMREELERERIKLKENKGRVMEEARREAKILVMDAKAEANSIIRDLEKMRESGKAENVGEKVKAARDKLKKREDSIDAQMKKAAKPKKVYAEPPKNLKPGDPVKILEMDNQEATVLKVPDKNGMVKVQAGIIKMDVHVTNLRLITDSKSKELADKYTRTTRAFESKTKNVSTEIDVRGQLSDEAYDNVSKFIDDCYLASVSPVRIIHGKGTGVLRKTVHDLLKKHKHVESFRLGKYGEGEDGVTVAELK